MVWAGPSRRFPVRGLDRGSGIASPTGAGVATLGLEPSPPAGKSCVQSSDGLDKA